MDVDAPPYDALLQRPDASTKRIEPKERVSYKFDTMIDTLSAPFLITKEKGKDYTRQFANLYFLRLELLKKKVIERANHRWSLLESRPTFVDRVLDVEQGKLCYVVGTVYMDMPLKPDVLEEIAREHNIIVPPPKEKIFSPEDHVTLEDASGRINLVGERIESKKWRFVTGIIAAVLGVETPNGAFDVVDICYAGLPPQQARPDLKAEQGQWVALTSGLELGGNDQADDLHVDLLAEYLTGELAGAESRDESSKINHLIIAGNSMRQPVKAAEEKDTKKPKRYGYDSSLYSARPTQAMNTFLTSILPSIDVCLLPGDKDPAIPTMPQQPLHPALLPDAKAYYGKGLHCATNPSWISLAGVQLLVTAGQPIDDIFKYLDDEDRLGMAHDTLDWSHIAPTAPDTLFCYPFSKTDPFILKNTPHVYVIGNQPEFATELMEGDHGQQVRIILVPKFSGSAQIALLNTATLDVKLIDFKL